MKWNAVPGQDWLAAPGQGAPPPGPVAAPLVPRYALLPAPSPWVRAGPRSQGAARTRAGVIHSWPLDRPDLGGRRLTTRVHPNNHACSLLTRVWPGRVRSAAQHVPRGTGREGARSEERAEQRLAPGGGAPCPGTVGTEQLVRCRASRDHNLFTLNRRIA